MPESASTWSIYEIHDIEFVFVIIIHIATFKSKKRKKTNLHNFIDSASVPVTQ